jgi:thiol-disulfide isomerase/thioredoxin
MRIHTLAATLALCAVLACSSNGSAERADATPPAVPVAQQTSTETVVELFPGFALPDLQGKEVSLEDLAGKVILVVFWATWCPPCVAEVPVLNELQETYAEQGLEVVAIAVDPRESVEKIEKFVDEKDVTYTVLKGAKDTGRRYQVRGIPTTYLIGRNGQQLQKFVGYTQHEVVEQAIVAALGD